MKYVKYTKAALLCIVLILFGCANNGGPKSDLSSEAASRPDMASTLEYVPKPKPDDEGGFHPYEPRENPYLSQRGKVDKNSVLKFIEARRAFKADQHDQAQQLLEELAAQDERLSGPWVMLGDIAMEKDDYERAINHYNRAIEVNRLNVNAYLRLAKTQRLQGKFMHAQNTYAEVLALWPDFPEAHLNLAVLYDVYLNHPLRAQKHMETYRFLADSEDERVADWLAEIQERTGVAPGQL